jgi:hypothetical protein
MPCHPFHDPKTGARGFVCTRSRRRRCVGCGQLVSDYRLCDARLKSKPGKTCDAAVCARCTTVPAPEKDLCPEHAAAWRARQSEQGAA